MKQNESVQPKRNTVDSAEDQTINVKLIDTENAICRDPFRCAIARAIVRQMKGSVKAKVGVRTVLVFPKNPKKPAQRFLLDSTGSDSVRYFDRKNTDGDNFPPCPIILHNPKGVLKLGSRTGRNARSGPSSPPSRKRSRAQLHRIKPTRQFHAYKNPE